MPRCTPLLPFLFLLVASCGDIDSDAPASRDTVARDDRPAAPAPSADTASAMTVARLDSFRIEGMWERRTMRRVGDDLPFTTWYPFEEMRYEQSASDEGVAALFVPTFGGVERPEAGLRIFVPSPSRTPAEVERLVREHVAPSNGWSLEPVERGNTESCPPGTTRHLRLRAGDGGGGWLCIGEAAGKGWYAAAVAPTEMSEGFAPRAAYILRQLRWEE